MILRNDSSNNDNLREEEQNKETSLSINIYKGKEFVMMRPLTMSPVLVSQFLILVRIIDRCWPRPESHYFADLRSTVSCGGAEQPGPGA